MTVLEIPIDLVKVGSPPLGTLEYHCKDCGKVLTADQYYDLVNHPNCAIEIRSCRNHNFSVRRKGG